MKKYLTFTALLATVAIVSVSYLAQAEDAVTEMETDTGTVVEKNINDEQFQADHDACMEEATTAAENDETQETSTFDANYTDCMTEKGYAADALPADEIEGTIDGETGEELYEEETTIEE